MTNLQEFLPLLLLLENSSFKHHVNNAFDLAEDLTSVMTEENEQFISHDIVPLFTNTPTDECLKTMKDR